jgi:hypothetical protein
MGQMVFEPMESWNLGAHATPAQDLAPNGTFAVGQNTVLQHNTGATAIIAQREGWNLQTAEPMVDRPKIIGQYDFVRTIGTNPAQSTHLVVGSTGRLDKMPQTRVLEPADPLQPIPFTPGVYPPSFTTMKNFCFIANGMDPLQVYNGTKVYDAGIVAPAPPTLAIGGGILPADTYSVVITYYDATSGLESSSSSEVELVLGAAGGVTVTWGPYTGEHPYTHTRVYIRQNSNQTEHFLAAEIPVPTTSTTISLSQDHLDALTVIAPDEDENDPPPTGLIGVEAHVSRIFGHNGSRVFYSNLDSPEAWDPDNSFSVNTDDGSRITALFAAHEVLIIFKRDTVWALYGEDPATWTKPYTFMIRLKKAEGHIYEYACHEGNYAMEGILGGARREEEAARKKK